MGRAQGRPADFHPGEPVLYRPGMGTYGYEDFIDANGQIRAHVLGHTPTRVRIRMYLTGDYMRERAVDAASLTHRPGLAWL